MRGPLAHAALVVFAAVVLTACQQVDASMREAEPYACPPEECDPPRPEGPGGHLVVEAGEFFFEILEDTAAEGTVTVELHNIGGTDHDFTIDGAIGGISVPPGHVGQGGESLPGGETTEGELQLFAGSYVYYCSVPGHREQGMEGTIEIPAQREDLPGEDDPEVEEEGAGDPGDPDDPEEAGEDPADPGETVEGDGEAVGREDEDGS